MSAAPRPTPHVTVVIVAYNSAGELPGCIASIRAETTAPTEIIVVDNASADGSADVAEALLGPGSVIRSDRNVGFAAACNTGAAAASGRILLFLNPDTSVRDGAIDRACAFLEADPSIGIVGAKTVYPDGSVNPSCCFREPSLASFAFEALALNALFRASGLANRDAMGGWDRQDTRDVDVVAGCFLMIRAELFRELGGFDERFFMYSEDVDLSRRVRASGQRCVHYAGATVVHEGGRSDVVRAEKRAKVYAGRALYVDKHWPSWQARAAIALMTLGALVRAAGATVVRDPARRSTLRELWRLRSVWRTAVASRAIERGGDPDELERAARPPSAPPLTAGRLVEPRPWRNRGRLAVRWTRFTLDSLRRGYRDFAANGVRAIGLLLRHTAADLGRGGAVACNVCGWKGRRFYPNTGPGYDERDTICPGCLCQDRHRSLVALLSADGMLAVGRRVVEVAPMRGLERLFLALPIDYTSFDIARHAMERGDVTAMRYPSDSVDTFIAMHVLEHLPEEDLALQEIMRVLRPGGAAALQVPVDWERATTTEYAEPDPREVGHVRAYGRDFADRLAAHGFEVEARSVADLYDAEEIRRFGLSTEPIFIARKPVDVPARSRARLGAARR